MSPIIGRTRIIAAFALTLLAYGCSNPQAGSLINPDTGKHQAQWASAGAHGATAKAAPSSVSGFAACQECHQVDFSGGSSRTSCLNTAGCHGAAVAAPHSPKPWRGGARSHTSSDPGNAPVCARCHAGGLNSSLAPLTPAAPGTPPGCFNSTLCHGTAGHAAGWADPAVHGASAKGTPSGSSGFSYCQTCHGSDFLGGTALRSCLNNAGCHGAAVAAPHSPKPWRSATRSHAGTDTGNAPVCAPCHAGGLNSSLAPLTPAAPGTPPGCFNSTLCHGAMGHAAGWADPAAHGASAKSAPSGSSGFSYCQTCHGSGFQGGIVLRSCLNAAGCHGAAVAAPHSPKPWRGGARTHTNTDPGNVAICAPCHAGGLNSPVTPATPASPGTPPGCFNSTLCHGSAGAPHALPFTNANLHGPQAKQDLTYCQGCHATPSAGGAGSNPRFNVPIGRLVTGCESASCHAAGTAHPVPWKYVYATSHQSAGNMAVACALCHGATLGGGTGPACSTCHTAGSPLAARNCTSCHVIPPNGAAAPNRAGSHAKHNALANVTGQCAVCHNNGGTGTANHAYGRTSVFVSFSSMYNAKSGTAAYSATGICSNITCHGGKATPAWSTGTINVSTQCTSCHASGTTQYNSYSSGDHSRHSGVSCTNCHDAALLAVNHFTHLDTAAMEGPESSTILANVNYTSGSRSCSPTCHNSQGVSNPQTW